jgi:hypothetical protein
VCALDAGTNGNRKKGRRACLPCVGQPAGIVPAGLSVHYSMIISSHPELTLLASVDALSNSSLPHNPPRSGRQCEHCEGCCSHVSHFSFCDGPAWRNTQKGIQTACAASALISSVISQCIEMKVMPRGHASRGLAATWKLSLSICCRRSPGWHFKLSAGRPRSSSGFEIAPSSPLCKHIFAVLWIIHISPIMIELGPGANSTSDLCLS